MNDLQHDLHDDDQPVGRLLGRREVLALFGSLGAGAVVIAGAGLTFGQDATALPEVTPEATASPVPSCVVRPALTEGPYFVDGALNRSDIRVEPSDESVVAGTLLKLKFVVTDVTGGTCKPLPGAQVDVWHADAEGVYSGVTDAGFDTSELMFLRGYQITDEDGQAEFITIYPGWYSGRAVHIHFKIRTDPEAETGYEFTSQFFFDEELTDEVHAVAPYAAKGRRNTFNETDNIFQSSEGLLTLNLVEYEDEETGEEGYETTFDIGLDLSVDTSAQSDFNQGGPGGRGGTPPTRP
ncbi:MAG: intradiol ring-cleavage dioxygenase [Anaerolineae bacterium]|nr:intradiol ring-cleavage dioxygenase [Anaerolineae bacterium]